MRSHKIKLLKFVNGNDDGGVFTSESNYILCLKDLGVTVDLVIVGEGDRVLTYQQLADKNVHLPSLHSNLGGGFIKKIREILKIWLYGSRHKKRVSTLGTQYTAIIYRRPIFVFLAGMVGAALRTKVFWHMPNIVSNKFSRWFYTSCFKKYSIIPIANSEYTKSTLPNICKHVIYPGYSAHRVGKVSDTFRQELNIDQGASVFGMAGRICFDKAQDILIEAFLASNAIRKGAHLIFAGRFETEDLKRELESLCGDFLGNRIHFLGRIDDLPKFYSTIDIALNGRRNVEPFGISIAEAQAAAKPVIAYYLGGPSEMIEDGKSGWLVRSPDANSWMNAFNDALDKKAAWAKMGQRATEGLSKFSVENNVKKLLELIHA